MTEYIPLFPLKLVPFPGEDLNLHIFEPRYKQLITDCMEKKTSFGVAVYLDELTQYGTEVELVEVFKTYEDGKLDIRTKAVRPFEILTFDNPIMGKLYAGGEVKYLENDPKVSEVIYNEFMFYLKEMMRLLNYDVDLSTFTISSFTFAHVLGLKIEEEFELLLITKEEERQIYLINHFKKMIPIMKDVEHAKEKIKMNGHFKNLDPLNF
jgi:uncharacterized protein